MLNQDDHVGWLDTPQGGKRPNLGCENGQLLDDPLASKIIKVGNIIWKHDIYMMFPAAPATTSTSRTFQRALWGILWCGLWDDWSLYLWRHHQVDCLTPNPPNLKQGGWGCITYLYDRGSFTIDIIVCWRKKGMIRIVPPQIWVETSKLWTYSEVLCDPGTQITFLATMHLDLPWSTFSPETSTRHVAIGYMWWRMMETVTRNNLHSKVVQLLKKGQHQKSI